MAYQITLSRVFRQTSRMNCWFYAAKTIVYFRTRRLLLEADYLGSILTAPPLRLIEGPITGRDAPVAHWLRSGLPATHIPDFCERFGFRRTASRSATWTAEQLEQILRDCGPLFFGGHRGDAHHVIVLSGVDASQNVHYGDPATGQMAAGPLASFNEWMRQVYRLPNGAVFDLWNPLYHP